MAQTVGWRPFWWLNVGMLGLSIVMIIFMFPETKVSKTEIEIKPMLRILNPANLFTLQRTYYALFNSRVC